MVPLEAGEENWIWASVDTARKRSCGRYGTEFTSKALDHWAYRNEVHLDFIRPGRPRERLHRELQRKAARRVPERGGILQPCRRSSQAVSLATRLRPPAPALRAGRTYDGRVRSHLQRSQIKTAAVPPCCLRHSPELQSLQIRPSTRPEPNHASRIFQPPLA